ncbi:hypothetical protein N7501_009581 [Penicillium viridicatum]|nr:hypothetical protein N7501_009581 [Penicillium viridicatum]
MTLGEEAIAKFLYNNIFIVYSVSTEFLIDNSVNLLATSVEYFIKLINTKYRTITLYYLRTNRKVENLNGLLGRILTKYYIGPLLTLSPIRYLG